jgi:hypothetical protein
VSLKLGPWAPEALLPVTQTKFVSFFFKLSYLPWLLEGTMIVLTEPCAE